MADKKRIIRLKEGEAKREISAGNHTIVALPDTDIEVPLRELQLWLSTGFFEEVADPGFPPDFPGREALVAGGATFEQVKTLDKAALLKIKNIGEATADKILEAVEALNADDGDGSEDDTTGAKDADTTENTGGND